MDLARFKDALAEHGRLVLRIRVIPRCQRTEWAEAMEGGALKLRLHAVPEKGKGNEELIRFLAAEFALPRAQIRVLAGAAGQNKQVLLSR